MTNGGYLDIHTHIVPAIDDGSRSWDMTREMLRLEHEQGVDTIIATSHFYPGETTLDPTEYRNMVAKVDEMAKEMYPEMNVYPGNELFYQPGVARHIADGTIQSLADSKYVLLEFHPAAQKRTVIDGVRELLDAGYVPLIAHIERVECIFGHDKEVDELIKMGCYIQTNTGSLMGGMFDKRSKILKRWIADGRIHFLGSDCHRVEQRTPLMKDAVEKLYKSVPGEAVERITVRNKELFLAKKYL